MINGYSKRLSQQCGPFGVHCHAEGEKEENWPASRLLTCHLVLGANRSKTSQNKQMLQLLDGLPGHSILAMHLARNLSIKHLHAGSYL